MPDLRRLRSQSGMTLVELLVTISLLIVVGVFFSLILTSVQRGIARQADRSNDNDQARLAVQQLDRDIRSGNVLYDPASESDAYFSLRLYTQSFADLHTSGNRCVQWRLVGTDLQRRYWATNWSTNPSALVSGWRVVASDVVNRSVGTRLFELDGDPSKGGRLVVVQVITQTREAAGSPIRIRASIAGRNTAYGYPQNICSSVPPV